MTPEEEKERAEYRRRMFKAHQAGINSHMLVFILLSPEEKSILTLASAKAGMKLAD